MELNNYTKPNSNRKQYGRDEMITMLCCNTATIEILREYLINRVNPLKNEVTRIYKELNKYDSKLCMNEDDETLIINGESIMLKDISDILDLHKLKNYYLNKYNKLEPNLISLITRRKQIIDILTANLITLDKEFKVLNTKITLYNNKINLIDAKISVIIDDI